MNKRSLNELFCDMIEVTKIGSLKLPIFYEQIFPKNLNKKQRK